MQNIVLIGMPGCGKSTCGVLVAKTLCMDFTDTDLIIQKTEGMSLQSVIDTKGNDYFAEAEENAICNTHFQNAVIATGGSVVYSDKTMTYLKENACVIYLRISFDTMLRRIADITSRGILLRNGETMEAMFAERAPLYEKYADLIIDCDGRKTEDTVFEIAQQVSRRLENAAQ